jgi:hypothetical protein
MAPMSWSWPAWLSLRKAAAHSEVHAMLTQAEQLQKQLRQTEVGLADFLARAERISQLMDSQGGATDEL